MLPRGALRSRSTGFLLLTGSLVGSLTRSLTGYLTGVYSRWLMKVSHPWSHPIIINPLQPLILFYTQLIFVVLIPQPWGQKDISRSPRNFDRVYFAFDSSVFVNIYYYIAIKSYGTIAFIWVDLMSLH